MVLIVAWIIGLGAERLAPGQYDSGTIEAMAELILMGGAALLIRMKVFSEHTVRKAGFTPNELQSRADSPAIQPAVGD